MGWATISSQIYTQLPFQVSNNSRCCLTIINGFVQSLVSIDLTFERRPTSPQFRTFFFDELIPEYAYLIFNLPNGQVALNYTLFRIPQLLTSSTKHRYFSGFLLLT